MGMTAETGAATRGRAGSMGEISGFSSHPTAPPAVKTPRRRPAGGGAIRTGSALALSIVLAQPAMRSYASGDPSAIPGGAYVLDEQGSSLFATVRYAGGLARARLRFTRLEGALVYVQGDVERSRVMIKVDSTSADAGQNAFNGAIARSLGSDRHPTITFVSKGLTIHDEWVADLDGDLTLRGVTRPLRLSVVMEDVASGEAGRATRIRFSGRGRIRRSDSGVSVPGPFVRDVVALRFDVAFTGPETR
jgi:polyisoprenoid-binding protein YceI